MFVRSEYSPPPEVFNRTQREYDELCQWFKSVAGAIPRELPAGEPVISWESLPPEPQIADEQLKDTVRLFKETLDSYNDAAKTDTDLQVKSQRTDGDSFFIFLLPLSLSLALALQATKLTAETWVEDMVVHIATDNVLYHPPSGLASGHSRLCPRHRLSAHLFAHAKCANWHF